MTVAFQALGMTASGRSVRIFEDVAWSGPTTVRALIEAVAPEAAALARAGATVLLNGERAGLDSPVADGDEVSVVQALAGG